MKIAVNAGSGARASIKMHFNTGAGTKDVVRAWLRDETGSKLFFTQLGVSISTSSVIGRGNSAATIHVTSSPVTATTQGTVGTVTHNWTRTDGGSQPWTIDNPNSATTTFSTDCDQGDNFTATFVDTVTDQGGQSLASDTVTADCANIYYAGGYPGAFGTPGTPYP